MRYVANLRAITLYEERLDLVLDIVKSHPLLVFLLEVSLAILAS